MSKGKLVEKFDFVMAEAKEVFEDFPWEDPYAYAMWLQQTNHFVENSTRLFALTAARLPSHRNDFHRRLLSHGSEELGHEKLLVRDIAALNLGKVELPVLPLTQAFYQTQFYWIERVEPVSFYGYIFFLEGLAVSHARPAIERILKAHGPKALTFLKLHAEEDESHVEKAFETVTGKVTPQEEAWIIQNMETCCTLYLGFMKEIAAKYCSKQFKRAG